MCTPLPTGKKILSALNCSYYGSYPRAYCLSARILVSTHFVFQLMSGRFKSPPILTTAFSNFWLIPSMVLHSFSLYSISLLGGPYKDPTKRVLFLSSVRFKKGGCQLLVKEGATITGKLPLMLS